MTILFREFQNTRGGAREGDQTQQTRDIKRLQSQFRYDTQGRITGMARGTRTNTLAYDAAGNLASITDPLSRTVAFQYDAAGRVATQVLPDLRTIQFGYDEKGNVTSITPPGRPAHEFLYTPTDQQQFYIPPNVTPPLAEPRTRYDYYLDGRLARMVRPDGQAIAITYDPESGDPFVMTTPTGQITYAYNSATGNLEVVTAPDEQMQYTYDGSLLKAETWTGTVSGTVSRTYDNNFHLTSQSVNGSNAISFSYDADDLLTGAGAMTLTRDATNGALASTTLGSVSDTLGYNSFGEVTSYVASLQSGDGSPATGVYEVHYTRDDLGRITSKTETGVGRPVTGDTYQYTYDGAGRVTDVVLNGAPTAHYDYDANSNRVGGFNVAGTISASYDAQDRLVTYGTSTYSYTANGELTSKTTPVAGHPSPDVTQYSYDVLGNLRRVDLPDGRVVEYVIDGQNRRVGKKVNGVLVQGFLYDGQLRVVAELDAAGNIVSRFVYGTKVNVPEYLVRSPDAQHPTPVTYRIITDHLGSPRLVVNVADGTIARRIDYDEFGNITPDTQQPTPDGFDIPSGFAGGLYDPDTGLVRFGARDYDPETGRWTAKDPIGFAGGDANLYVYALNNALNVLDPGGRTDLQQVSVGMALFNGMVSGISTYVAVSTDCPRVAPGAAATAAAVAFGTSLFSDPYLRLAFSVLESMFSTALVQSNTSLPPQVDPASLGISGFVAFSVSIWSASQSSFGPLSGALVAGAAAGGLDYLGEMGLGYFRQVVGRPSNYQLSHAMCH